MAELNKAILPKWIMAKDTGELKSVSAPIGLGGRVFIKGVTGDLNLLTVCILDAGHDGEGIVGARRDMAIILTFSASDANRLSIVRDLTSWLAKAGSTDITNTSNSRMLFLDGDNLSSFTNIINVAISDVEVREDIIA